MLYRGQSIAGFPAAEVAPEKSVAARAFPVLLICDTADVVLPCRHAERIYAAARGPKQLWVVPRAFHTSALGFQPEEFRRRVLSFFAAAASSNLTSTRKRQAASTSFTMRQRESESPLPQAAGRKPQGVRFAVVDIGEGAGADVSQSGQFCEMFRRILCR
jgi:hypothetical protein